MSALDFIEAVLMEYAGPMGKFVLRKKIKEMGFEWESFPEDKLWEISQQVVPAAIFDDEVQRKVLGILKKVLPTPSSLSL